MAPGKAACAGNFAREACSSPSHIVMVVIADGHIVMVVIADGRSGAYLAVPCRTKEAKSLGPLRLRAIGEYSFFCEL